METRLTYRARSGTNTRSMHTESLSPRVFRKVYLNERRNGSTDGLRNAF